jgi:hypothetical protein
MHDAQRRAFEIAAGGLNCDEGETALENGIRAIPVSTPFERFVAFALGSSL